MSPFGDTCSVISQWHLSTMPYSVCYHIASLLIESETQFRAHRHSLLALRWHSESTLNMKNVLLLDLKFDPDFVLNQFIASVPTESNEINVKFKSLPEVGFLLALCLGQCLHHWRLTFPSYLLPPSFTLHSFFSRLDSCHLFRKYSVL